MVYVRCIVYVRCMVLVRCMHVYIYMCMYPCYIYVRYYMHKYGTGMLSMHICLVYAWHVTGWSTCGI